MPTYEYRCEKCGLTFEARQTMSEHDNGWAECPRCHTCDAVEPRPSTFHAVTSRKS